MVVGLFIVGLFGVIWFVILVGIFILSGLGLYRMAQHAGIPSPWMAFVPVTNMYLIGLLAERSYYTYNGRVRRLAKWNVILSLLSLATALLLYGAILVSIISYSEEMTALLLSPVFFLVLIATVALSVYCMYYIFRDYAPDNAVLYTVVSMVCNISFVFFLVERHTVPVSVTGFGAYPYGRPKYDRWHQWNHMPPQQYGPGFGPPQGGGPNTTGPEDYYRG